MMIADWLMVGATLAGPVLAVQAQKWIERYTDEKRQKLQVFSTLMATRATRLSPDHVRALNSIDLVFKDNKDVIIAWREYCDFLSSIGPDNEVQEQNNQLDKLHAILISMGRLLKYDLDKVMLKRMSYVPQAHVDAENSQLEIQKGLRQMLAGQHDVQQALLPFLSEGRALKVAIDNQTEMVGK